LYTTWGFAKKLEGLNSGDTNLDHNNADNAIMDFFKNIGCNEIVDAFKKIEKWYS